MALRRNKASAIRGRKSKIKDEEPVYCICRSSDISRFMIACDQCEEWYHGDCIHVTAKQAENIKRFFCEKCRRKNSALEIEYKSKTKELKSDKRDKKKKRKRDSKLFDDEPPLIPVKKSRSGSTLLNSESKSSLRKDKYTSARHQLVEREYPPPAVSHSFDSRSARKRTSSSSGMLPGDDLDDPDEAMLPPDKDLQDDSATDDELETQGLPPALSDEDDSNDEREHDPRSGNRSVDDTDLLDPSADHDGKSWSDYDGAGTNKINRRCGQCDACHRSEDCGNCDFCKDMRKFGGPNRMRQKCRLRQCVNLGLTNCVNRPRARHSDFYHYDKELGSPDGLNSSRDDDGSNKFDIYEDAYAPEGHHPGSDRRGTQKMRKNDYIMMLPGGDRRGNAAGIGGNGVSRRRAVGSSPIRSRSSHLTGGRRLGSGYHNAVSNYSDTDEDSDGKLSDYRQCLGPKCILAARPSSSYCSDECAVKMATNSRSTVANNFASSRSLSKWQHHNSGGLKEVVFVPYNLSYPDHLYCKHHRYYNWHDQGVGLPAEVGGLGVSSSVVGLAGSASSTMASINSVHSEGLSLSNHPVHHQLVSGNANHHHQAGSLAAVGLHPSMLNDEPVEEYYTINETDNLEINWPQETVAHSTSTV